MNELDQEAIQRFWANNDCTYAGDTNATGILRVIPKKYVAEQSIVLDVGAGSGRLISLIPNATGIDIAPKSKLVAVGDISNLEFPDNFYTTVFACEVLEHLTGKALTNGLKEIYRVMETGGHFIVTTPDSERLEDNSVTCPFCSKHYHRWGHLRSFTGESLRTLMELAGFKNIVVKSYPLGYVAKHSIKWRMVSLPSWILNLFGSEFKGLYCSLVAIGEK